MGTSYDVIIGHSVGGTVALTLLPFLPENETTVILVDPPIEMTDEKLKMYKGVALNEATNVKTADEFMAENPAWSRTDCVLRTLAVSICDHTVEDVLQHNTPWSFSGLFKDIPPNVKVTVLIADPQLSDICRLEHIPCDSERLSATIVTGVGHRIQPERPGAIWPIMDVIPQPRAEL
ncbi:hypothetical protein M405DRAFT_841491 [Rhizopogon salebrosus TDB-379]|nr:hypothetical protein M405DRAFT_841491 [Rhizopogon salebrosus TDB-379]